MSDGREEREEAQRRREEESREFLEDQIDRDRLYEERPERHDS